MIIAAPCIDSKPNSYDQPIVTSSATTVPAFQLKPFCAFSKPLRRRLSSLVVKDQFWEASYRNSPVAHD